MGGFGYYGKIPAQGDFLRRGLTPGFVEPWDRWLQALMLSGRASLGAGWQDAYFSAPIWRFALPGGVCGPAAVAGVLMPSVDRVGRQFPLTLAAEIEAPSALAAYRAAAPAFGALEEAALAMLDDGAAREMLERRLGAVAPGPVPGEVAAHQVAGALCLAGAEAPLADLLAGAALAARPPGATLWLATVDGASRAMTCTGLPQGDALMRGLVDLGAPVWSGGAGAAITGDLWP
ncbi:MAG: type VI secretion system-associated protein TagF [Thermohalobaculum sp.]|nr:type VI secretion system-associated protein TagF [Thermohalobaculum sp.]